ncbi:MAG: beta-ketoacyl-ACP synthase 3 [Bacteroidales bacterium]|jgi:3-oxoacyl-[acyl-carrier-protein] synthase III|nr:beta-ketoacyl-ACP synthase 3 [Bacteroidales bacterium]MDD2205088.1 beta-ketoacyl-ACP synthase 3 [Bacteroidales bacterium]MDD3152550.1 beta-ketoacyl-ACP synthase 3 [Bacteroidales bacterium]MDD3914570.1 beta-ketoacyl-ACP synthase 3 [Bacteroidales bacterium]MDD4634485.1 beta-ketoacyl-ACP synthase 3 [Bacteroidales bacterium]
MKIIGTGKALPALRVSNDMLAEFLDTSDEWIRTRTGIKERRLLSDEDLFDLSRIAANEALIDAGISASDIDYMICSNVANNYVTPSLSCILQGLIHAECPCIDINGACSGFIYALDIAESFLKTKDDINNILIVCAEEPSRFTNWNERDTSVLFGDGAGAVVLTKGDDLLAMQLSSQSKVEPLYYQRNLEKTPYNKKPEGNAPLVMHGKDVYKLAVSSSVLDINSIFKSANISADDVDYFLLHQANIRIIDAIRQQLEQPEVKFPHNIENYGNTSSASIPILLDELHKSGKIEEGDVLLLSAFGAGFTTGACALRWSLS